MNAPHFGPWQRRLMAVHDQQLRRCWFCGAWAYARNDCKDCAAPAERPHDWKQEDTA